MNNFFRDYRSLFAGPIALLLLVLAYRFFISDFSGIAFEFSFTDFLSLLMAMFAILMSALFYFKAEETSNKFYDNTYRFMKDTSEVLGRVEASFGERLKHLDEGYSRMRDQFDRAYPTDDRAESVKSQKAQIEREEEKRLEIINELFEKSRMDEAEKSVLRERLGATELELSEARQKLAELTTEERHSPVIASVSAMRSYIKDELTRRNPIQVLRRMTDEELEREFDNIHPELVSPFLMDMEAHGFMSNRKLTTIGKRFLRSAISI